MSKQLMQLTRAALLIALVLVLQALASSLPATPILGIGLKQLVTGSLVNLVLIVSAATVGLFPGMTVGLLSSIMAQLLGITPMPQMLPVTALGNIVIVIVAWCFLQKKSVPVRILGIIAGAAVKCGVMWILTDYIIVPTLSVPEAQLNSITFMYSWPQAVTALAGGLIALAILIPLEKVIKKQE